jgi:hypothetical protein
MPVFISYSHSDKDFVNKLAAQLAKNRIHIWVDTWELRVGDSLLSKIQQAIQQASALLVVLSKASTASEWCKKELNAGLIRELEEKRVVVLPLLLEECDIPIFLRDKLFADFRSNYDDGFRKVLEAVAGVTSDISGRIDEPEWNVSWAIDWGEVDARMWLRITLVEQAKDQPYCVLSDVFMLLNDIATSRYSEYEKVGLDFVARDLFLNLLVETEEFAKLYILIGDDLPQKLEITVHDPKTGLGFQVTVTCRRLGEDTGKDILFHVGQQIVQIAEQTRAAHRPLTEEESLKLMRIISQTPRRASKEDTGQTI